MSERIPSYRFKSRTQLQDELQDIYRTLEQHIAHAALLNKRLKCGDDVAGELQKTFNTCHQLSCNVRIILEDYLD